MPKKGEKKNQKRLEKKTTKEVNTKTIGTREKKGAGGQKKGGAAGGKAGSPTQSNMATPLSPGSPEPEPKKKEEAGSSRKSFSKVTMSKPPLDVGGGGASQEGGAACRQLPNLHIHVCGDDKCSENCIGLTLCDGRLGVELPAGGPAVAAEGNPIADAKGRRSSFFYYMPDKKEGEGEEAPAHEQQQPKCHTHRETPEKLVQKLVEKKLVEETVLGEDREVHCCDPDCEKPTA